MNTIKIINSELVHQLLPMSVCIDAMAKAMKAVSSDKVTNPPRVFSPVQGSEGLFGLMPGSAADLTVFGAKMLSLMPGNAAHGLPAIQGTVLLFDRDTGAPRALIDGTSITAIRTAAASGLATRLLARPNVCSHGIIGTGVQARYHAEAILSVRPSISQTLIWGRDRQKAERLAQDLSEHLAGQFIVAETIKDAACCDVVSTVTGAAMPILEGRWLEAGAHVNLVGSHEPSKREADTEAITASAVYVDHLQGAMTEAGDLLIPIGERRFHKKDIVGEIGTLAVGKIAGRASDKGITLYKSLGLFTQDLYAAWAVLQAASSARMGDKVSL